MNVLYIASLESFPGVEKVMPILQPFKLASREFKSQSTVIKINDKEIGGNKIAVIAGPCAVENEEMILKIAKDVAKAGANF